MPIDNAAPVVAGVPKFNVPSVDIGVPVAALGFKRVEDKEKLPEAGVPNKPNPGLD